ncbi:tRNA (guanosine(37)-N1)-methyltransferase TrmD, partial [bacterium]|nr:tRNA (guanosine(37)-N1)-methyltransferase TrmD [bacterium]
MKLAIITAFPNFFSGPFSESILRRAQERNLVEISLHDLRDYTTDKHRQVDDYPYGGGPGMVLKAEPFFKAVNHVTEIGRLASPKVILMTPQGRTYNQKIARELACESELIFLCGHYKGIDERVREHLATDEISIGDYILTGGELPSLVVIDSIVRLVPGVIGDMDSAETDSFERDLLDCPYYTRPDDLDGMK